jgi:general secretion pathway protein B
MSLILEALKKSEQQRRLGEAPTLGSPVVATRRRRNLLPVIVILIVVAAAAAWWLTRSAPPPAAPPPATGAATKPMTAEPAATVAAAPPRARPVSPPLASGGQGRVKRGTVLAPQESVKVEPPAADKRSAAATTRPAASPTAAGTAAPPAQKPLDKIGPAADDKPVARAPAAGADASLPSIWDLPYSTRKDLPAIDLTMHVYSSDPAGRFVVIKGARHVEGEELGQDLFLREIRQDGLVLEFKGERFFFPRSGR